MNCHGNNNKGNNYNPIKHMLHMVLCCGLPILIILSLPFIARYNAGVAGTLGIIAPFICPIMMIGMMFMMFRGNNKSCHSEDKLDSDKSVSTKNQDF